MGRNKRSIQFVATALLFLVAGCAAVAFQRAPKTSLDFLEDGKTTKEDVLLKLGPSFATFEGQRIISYRLAKSREGYLVMERTTNPNVPGGPAWLSGLEGKFNLMLIFDEHAILQRHSLVPID